jgi:hypothetical protein
VGDNLYVISRGKCEVRRAVVMMVMMIMVVVMVMLIMR